MAAFTLGGDTPEAQEFVLTPAPGPDVHVLPEPFPAPSTSPTPDVGGEPSFKPSVAWVAEGHYLAVVTWGSGSCPSGPHGIEVAPDQEVEIRLRRRFSAADVCSADMSGHVTVVQRPQGITPPSRCWLDSRTPR